MNELEERQVAGVSRVVRYIARLIEENKKLKTVAVRGEVSGLSRSDGGPVYFALKEGADLLNCVAWSKEARQLPEFEDGAEVIVEGDFTTYPARSLYQLQVKRLELSGIGKLYQKFEQLRRKFAAEGLFEKDRKRTFPPFPRRIALISARGKGAEDFLTTMARRAPHIKIEFVDATVQGDRAQFEIADALDAASRMDVDVIVLTRGGGTYEDLFPFNEEPVVRAIIRSRHPVLTGIAHTGNRHLADEVADRVAETPSNAAHVFGEIRDAYMRRLERIGQILDSRIERLIRDREQRVDNAASLFRRLTREFVSRRPQRFADLEHRLSRRSPAAGLAQRAQVLAGSVARLRVAGERFGERRETRLFSVRDHLRDAIRYRIAENHRRLSLLRTQLGVLDPYAPLERGFAMIYEGNRLVRDASTVPVGSLIRARLAHGTLKARVEETTDE